MRAMSLGGRVVTALLPALLVIGTGTATATGTGWATAPPAAKSAQEIRMHAPAAERWLIRLRLRLLPAAWGMVDKHRLRSRLWSTDGGAEYVVQIDGRSFLSDTRQSLLFQLPPKGIDEDAEEMELLFPYPVPESDEPVETPEGPIQLANPEVVKQGVLLPGDDSVLRPLHDDSAGIAYRPNIRGRDQRAFMLISFRAGGRLYEVFVPATPR